MKYNIDEGYLIQERQRIGNQLKSIREKKQMDRKQFADLMGISVSTVSKIEAGKWNFGIDILVIYGIHLDFKVDIFPLNDQETSLEWLPMEKEQAISRLNRKNQITPVIIKEI